MARRIHFRQATIAGAVPGYRPARTRPSLLRRLPWPVIGLVVVGSALAWVAFGSEQFLVRSVIVTGTVNEGVSHALEALKGKNILLLTTGGLERSLPKSQSSIASIHIVKGLPDTLRVNVTVRTPLVRWQTKDQTVLLDQGGVPFTLEPPPPSSVTDSLPLVRDAHDQPVTLGMPLVAPGFVQFVADLQRSFRDRINLDLTNLSVGETTRELEGITSSHLKLTFDTTRTLDPQLKTLAAVLATYGSNIHESIDLRVEGRAFYK